MDGQNMLTRVLLAATSPDLPARQEAEQQLSNAEQQDFGNFLRELSAELRNEQSPEVSRQLAGLLLKNAVSGQDKKIDSAKRARWQTVVPDVAAAIKKNACETLSSPIDNARGAACQVISKIARIEIPGGGWPDLIESLCQLVVGSSVPARKGALMAYGYICEDLQAIAEEVSDAEVIPAADCNKILTAVVTGMKETDPSVKLIATRALYHAVFFSYRNIHNEEERAYLMEAVLENIRFQDLHVRQAAWECVLQIASEYYEYLAQFMDKVGVLSLEAIQEGNEMTALPAVEFWNNICDEEIAILSGLSDRPLMNFVQQAKQVLLPILFEAMTKQEEAYADDWTLAMAAGTCLGLCAEVLRDEVLELTLAFVSVNFANEAWNRREAAVYAYGSIMEGPTAEKLQPLVAESFSQLCQRLEDTSVAVRDTTAWTIGRIAKFQYSCISNLLGVPDPSGAGLINLLLQHLNDEPRVANQICFALHEIAANSGGKSFPLIPKSETLPGGSALDVWLRPMVEALFNVTRRSDVEDSRLRAAAYTCIGEVVTSLNSPEKVLIVNGLHVNILQLLEQSVKSPLTDDVAQFQVELCGCLERCLRVSGRDAVSSVGEQTFTALLGVAYGNKLPPATDEESCPEFSLAAEDAFMAMNALAVAMGEDFAPMAPAFCRALHHGITKRDDETLCEKCIDMAGDLSRSLGKMFAGDQCKLIMHDLYLTLNDTQAKVSLKPKAMQTIGDVAFNVGGAEFASHLEWCLDLLKQATQTKIEQGPADNEEWVDFIKKLRDSVLWAYEGIFLGLQSDQKLQALRMHVPTILEFINLILDDPLSSEQNHLKALELLCDLVTAFPEIGANIAHARADFLKKIGDLGSRAGADPALQRQTKTLETLVTTK